MLREGQTGGPGQAAGYVWGGGETFYGTRVGPGWYQGGKGVQGAILSIANAYATQPQATPKPPSSQVQANYKPTASHPHATLMRLPSYPQATCAAAARTSRPGSTRLPDAILGGRPARLNPGGRASARAQMPPEAGAREDARPPELAGLPTTAGTKALTLLCRPQE